MATHHEDRIFSLFGEKAIGAAATDLVALERLLGAARGARAYCVSSLSERDGRELSLADALRASVGLERDTLVFCIDAERAYYENHEGERFVLAPRA